MKVYIVVSLIKVALSVQYYLKITLIFIYKALLRVVSSKLVTN